MLLKKLCSCWISEGCRSTTQLPEQVSVLTIIRGGKGRVKHPMLQEIQKNFVLVPRKGKHCAINWDARYKVQMNEEQLVKVKIVRFFFRKDSVWK